MGQLNQIEKIEVKSPAETVAFAKRFSENLTAGSIVAFYGDLGSGKTFMIQSLCRIWGTNESPTSPTFTIVNQYTTPNFFDVNHFDFYRIEHEAELQNLGLEDYFYSDSVCLIEWAEKVEKYLPLPHYRINIDSVDGQPEARVITLFKVGK